MPSTPIHSEGFLMTRPASRFYVARLALIPAMVFVTSVGLVSPALAHDGTTFVTQGQSIQAAIDAARPGDRIVVGRGTYPEQLTVNKDGIELVGLGASLVPPSSPVVNPCSGLAGPDTEAGICVTGTDVVLAPYAVEHRKVVSVGRRVQDVSIAGFDVRGFSGENVAVVGAQDARVIGNRLTDGAQYGLLTAGSTHTRAFANIVGTSTTFPFIGICADDVAGTVVSNNHISGYNTALCVQTPGEAVLNNDVSASCFGVFVDPGIDGAKIRGNHIKGTNPRCLDENAPFFFVLGIVVSGAVNTEVRRNRVEGQTAGGLPNGIVAGLAVAVDGTTGAVPSGNVVTQNTLSNNDLDLFVQNTGTGNVIKHNKCTTSDPPGLCG
jgi:hypothetical protein